MTGEKERILKMLEEGKINADEAYKLLDTIEKKTDEGKGRFFRIEVESGGERKVNVKIPTVIATKLMKVGGKLVSKFSTEASGKLEEYDIDIEEILKSVEDELYDIPSTIIDIDEDGEKIKIWIE
ncbi:hypothetical protein KAT89_06250 [candidate division WOR-3 bacterium]|nr:hypothetical protein [candidate division WOR-3 bacterium]